MPPSLKVYAILSFPDEVDSQVVNAVELKDLLIRRPNVMEKLSPQNKDRMAHQKLARLVQCDAAAKQVHHSDPQLMTCHKGTWDASGCQLNLPCHTNPCITGVFLVSW